MLGQNRATLPQPVAIIHPLVRSAYLKRLETTYNNKSEDVLVLETYHYNDTTEECGFDSYLVDLLSDLQDLKTQAEERVGSIDRVDISRS